MSRSAFLSAMSHEMRTPLNAIIGLTHLLRLDPSGPQAPERLARIASAAQQLLALVDDVLDVAKIESGQLRLEPADFSVELLTARILAAVADEARAKGLALSAEMSRVPRMLRGDSRRLSQALVKLLANAVEFTPSGSVTLTGSADDTQGAADRQCIRFEVRDTGIGIAAQRLEQIFSASESAARVREQAGGAGLSLGLTRRLARLMGGDAGVVSTPGSGSTFWITVELQTIEPELTGQPAGPLAGLRALLVDDLSEAHALLEPMLRRLGLRVDLAQSGAQALIAARAAQAMDDPYDVVLIDWLMPHMDGPETARRLFEQTPGEPPACVFISTSCDAAMREQALSLGVSNLLQKPVSYSTLNDHLMSLLVQPPVAVAPSAATFDAQHQLRAAHLGARVLLAEDNPVNQDVAKTLLTMAGLTVDIANNGREAVAMAGSRDYAVILMDVQMPELDGVQATRELRARDATARVPIVAMTANVHLSDRSDCVAAGMNDFIAKPVTPDALYSVLSRWLPLAEPGLSPHADVAASAAPLGSRASALAGLHGIAELNLDRGLAFCGGNAVVFRHALGEFVGLYGAGLPAVDALRRTPTSAPELAAVRRELHGIGGAAGALGMRPLSEAAASLGERLREADASGSDHAPADRGPDDFDAALAAFVGRLATLCARLRDALA